MAVPISLEEDIARLNRVLRKALLALAARGGAEQSCRLAARAWSELRERHAHEAERLTALLHGLARDTDPFHLQGDKDHE